MLKTYLNIFLILVCFLVTPFVYAESTNIVEMEVKGMSCPFCVYGLKKKLEKLPDVDKADVNLKENKARLTLKPGVTPDEMLYRNTVKDAGFTSGGISHYVREAHPE